MNYLGEILPGMIMASLIFLGCLSPFLIYQYGRRHYGWRLPEFLAKIMRSPYL